jgi:hypothetical protein
MTDPTSNPIDDAGGMDDAATEPAAAGEPTAEPTGDALVKADAELDSSRGQMARDVLGQLQTMIDSLATLAAPVIRQIGATGAERAAAAAERSGPVAQRAADATSDAGSRLAVRARGVAADLRRTDTADGDVAGEGLDGDPGTGPDAGAVQGEQPGRDPEPTA